MEGGEDAATYPRVESDAPASLTHADAIGPKPAGKLGSCTGHDDLRDILEPLQLAGEKPDLTLATAPLAARRDVYYSGAHPSETDSIGRLPLSRRRV